MVCLARLIRWAMVASGTRKALAISAVFRPPTARKVRAMADGWSQRGMAAHEQQDEGVVPVVLAGADHLGEAGPSSCSRCSSAATCSSRRRRACSLRT